MVKHRKKDTKDEKETKNNFLEKELENGRINTSIVYILFTIGFFVIFLSIISIVFPGLIISIVGDGEFIDPFEIGQMGILFVIVNIVVFTLLFLHTSHRLADSLGNVIGRIWEFDLSQKNSLIFLMIVLSIYVAFTAKELSYYEGNQFGDFLIVQKAIEIWPDGESDVSYVSEQLSRYVRMALLVASQEVFDNIKVIPYIASILLLVTTYFLTVKLSRKNFAGLVAVLLVIQSDTFLKYDTIAVYENFWALFYVFSIYLIFKSPRISSPFYLLSIFSKAITVLMLPITIIISLLSDIPKRKKIFVILTHLIVIAISIVIFSYTDSIYGNVIEINTSEFWIGFTTLAFNLRFDWILLLFLLPVSAGLFIKSRRGDRNSISLMVLMAGTILVTPVLEMITNFYFVYPYRYIPLIVFFAISASTLLSRR